MPAFKFLPLKTLEENLVKLMSAEYEAHQKANTKVPDVREQQMTVVDNVFTRLKLMAAEHDRRRIIEANRKQLDLYEAELKKLGELEKLDAEQEKLLKKIEAEVAALTQFNLNPENVEPLAEDQAFRLLSDEQRSKVATGALLVMKEQIRLEYTGLGNALIGLVKTNKPENSVLYSGVDTCIGVTPKTETDEGNELDEKSKKEALAAYNQFISMINDLNVKMASDIKDEQIHAEVAKQHKLKKVATPVEKVEKPRFEDSISSTLLMPNPQLAAQLNDKKVPQKTKKMIEEQLSEYTPASEVGRYVRDAKSEQSFRTTYSMLRYLDEQPNPKWNLHNHVVPQVNEPKLGTARDAKEEEKMGYAMTDKKYKTVRVFDPDTNKYKEPVQVLTGWKGEYKAEDKAKVKEAWKGVKEPSDVVLDTVAHEMNQEFSDYANKKGEKKEVEVDLTVKRSESVSFFRQNTKAAIEGFNAKRLKHVATKESHKIALTEDYDATQRPSMKKS